MLTNCIKFHKKSENTSFFTASCAAVQVFNTGMLFVVSSADASGSFLWPFKIFDGLYEDFNVLWYIDVGGNLIYTYLFIVFWPLIEWGYTWLFQVLGVLIDRSCSCDKTKTRAKTIQ